MKPGTLTAFSLGVEAAKGVFRALEAAGVDSRDVSVLARGVEVDKQLIFSSEINANQLAPRSSDAELSGLARKLSGEKRLLLEGCWAVGPIFEDSRDPAAGRSIDVLAEALLRAGLSLKEASRVESSLKNRGGIWLAFTGEENRIKNIEEKLRALEKVEVKRFSASPSSG